MKIKFLGHSAFLITSEAGIRILTDPYRPKEDLTYGEIEEAADIVTVSHEHGDHNNAAAVKGEPEIIKGTATAKGIGFKGIASDHDESGGQLRGKNTIICFEVDGVRACHLGDLGHPLNSSQVAEAGKVDVLFVPVGGYYTIDSAVAGEVCDTLAPKVVIPMHFKNDRCAFPISGVDEFLKGKENVTRLGVSELELKPNALPTSTQIVVLEPAL